LTMIFFLLVRTGNNCAPIISSITVRVLHQTAAIIILCVYMYNVTRVWVWNAYYTPYDVHSDGRTDRPTLLRVVSVSRIFNRLKCNIRPINVTRRPTLSSCHPAWNVYIHASASTGRADIASLSRAHSCV